MFDLKNVGEGPITPEEFVYATQCETGVNGRANVTYVFFATAQ
jgi:hypothetical protein